MTIIKHTQQGNYCYLSHIDNMRVLQRSLSRANIKTAMSQGYNPHPLTYCSHPLPVGVGSMAEYFCYIEKGTYALEEIKDKFNTATPDGIVVVDVMSTTINPNIAGKVVACDYQMQCKLTKKQVELVSEFLGRTTNMIDIPRKGESNMLDISSMIFGYEVNPSSLTMRLATGNPTLRVDKLIEVINSQVLKADRLLVTNAKRINQLAKINDELVDMDSYCRALGAISISNSKQDSK